jgi:hypothetical protein
LPRNIGFWRFAKSVIPPREAVKQKKNRDCT